MGREFDVPFKDRAPLVNSLLLEPISERFYYFPGVPPARDWSFNTQSTDHTELYPFILCQLYRQQIALLDVPLITSEANIYFLVTHFPHFHLTLMSPTLCQKPQRRMVSSGVGRGRRTANHPAEALMASSFTDHYKEYKWNTSNEHVSTESPPTILPPAGWVSAAATQGHLSLPPLILPQDLLFRLHIPGSNQARRLGIWVGIAASYKASRSCSRVLAGKEAGETTPVVRL